MDVTIVYSFQYYLKGQKIIQMKLKAPNAHLDIVSSTDPAFRDIVKIFGLFKNEKPGELVLTQKTWYKRIIKHFHLFWL